MTSHGGEGERSLKNSQREGKINVRTNEQMEGYHCEMERAKTKNTANGNMELRSLYLKIKGWFFGTGARVETVSVFHLHVHRK